MSNCITLNTASITSIDTIKTIVPIAQGPKGDKGDRGERGPQGLPGNARINDSVVSGVETWSSKKIVDYVQDKTTVWTQKEVEGDGKVDHTNKGYIKGLEIEGNTIKSGNSVQGVGLKTKEGYKIGVKTHGKNLLNIKDPKKWLLESTGDIPRREECISFIAKVKPNTSYTITKENLTEFGRGAIISYVNYPHEGLNVGAEQIYNENNLTKKTFTTLENTQYIGIYCALNKELKPINEVIKNLQLEEGTQATKYEPYKESIQEVIIQQQLNTGDKLVFENGEYVIKTSKGQTVKTNINNEMLPATFEGVTYVEQDAGVKGTLKGEFPINSQAVIASLENKNKELEERLGQQEEMLTTLYSFYANTLEEV